jgi:hydrogenase maturation factor
VTGDGERCVTCADEAIVMRVLEAPSDGLALCSTERGNRAQVMMGLVGDVKPGDSVLVHAGTALSVSERREDVP